MPEQNVPEQMGPDPGPEHLDVLVVGAGLSGVGAAYYLQRDCPWARYAILEARGAIGGTWDLFRFPGIRSDSDMYTLGYSFRPWPGENSIADGESILRYIRETASESGIEGQIRFNHRVVAADWSTDEACWNITAQRVDTGETIHLTAGFLFSCCGYYRYDHGYVPDFAGMERFGGTIVHPQQWPGDLDVSGKQVVVIGSGATAVTLVPPLSHSAGHVTMLQRSPTYIASLSTWNPVPGLLRKVLPKGGADGAIRWFHALANQAFYRISRRKPAFMRRVLIRGVTEQLPEGYDVRTHFTPRYDPWDQRVCLVPDGDLFKAISAGRVSVVTDRIETFTERGLLLRSGTELDADIIVTATGLELLFLGGVSVRVDGNAVDARNRLTYKGMMLEDVPNLALAIGYTNASWTLKCDLTCDYVCRLLNHMHSRGQRQCTPRNKDATVASTPLLGLSSGYIERAAHTFPRQGSKSPWLVRQSYLADYRTIKLGSIDDSVMEFTDGGVPANDGFAAAL